MTLTSSQICLKTTLRFLLNIIICDTFSFGKLSNFIQYSFNKTEVTVDAKIYISVL